MSVVVLGRFIDVRSMHHMVQPSQEEDETAAEEAKERECGRPP